MPTSPTADPRLPLIVLSVFARLPNPVQQDRPPLAKARFWMATGPDDVAEVRRAGDRLA